MRKGKLLTAVIAIISIVLLAVVGIVNASNTKSYLVEVIDDGSSNLNGNDQSEITKKIIQNNASDIVYEVNLKNKTEVAASKEVTIFVDTSRSTGINDPEKNVIAKATNLAELLCDKVPGIKINVADSNSVKITQSTDKNAIVQTINSLEVKDGDTVDESIERAANSFSSDSKSSKSMIIFTDATDAMKKVKEIKSKGIYVVSILDNMSRQSFEENGESTIGKTYMVNNIDTDNVVNSLNKALSKIVVKDEFSEEILKYFDFSVVSKGDTDTVTTTETGYTWNISELQANNASATLQFKLTLKDSSKINASDAFKNINTSKNMNVQYENLGETKTYDVAESPIVVICEKYSLTVQAVSEENKDLPVDGINVKATATREDGKVVYDDTLTTDGNGKVLIDNLKTLGKLTFTVIPEVDKTGYQTSPSITFNTYNEEKGKALTVTTDNIDSTVDNAKRNILVKLPISTQKFSLEVNLAEDNNSSVKIGNIEFRLIQPTINSKYELSALYGTSGTDGKVIFNPSIMPKAGTYDYILSQTTEKEGYESFGNVTLRITFDDNGKVTNIEKKYNSKVEVKRVNETYAIVNAYNVNKSTDRFNFEIEVSNKDNDKEKIDGAIYNIEVSTDDQGSVTYNMQKTDENGKINLKLSGSGYIRIKVKEISPKLGYYQDQVEKEMIVYRNNGKLQYVARAVPSDLDVKIYSDENKVKLNLKSSINANPSAIQVQVADMEENDIFIPGISVKLIGNLTNEEYTGTTDSEGKVTFLVQPQLAGVYPYEIQIDNSTIPKNYSKINEKISLSATFGDNKEIVDSSDNGGPFFDCRPIEYTKDDFTYHAAYAGIGLQLSEEDSYNLNIQLTDEEDGKAIKGAAYNITIDDGANVRTVSGRQTNVDGLISTRLVAADNLTIRIKQIKSPFGYIIDSTEQIIELQREDGVYEIVEQNPYDYSDNKNGTKINGKNVIFYHTNKKKNNDSVRLNLYVNKMDKNEDKLGNIPINIYSDTLKDSEGNLLDKQLETDENGYIELEQIQVTNIQIPRDSEHIIYIVETDAEGNPKENTRIKLKITFRYNEEKQLVELTNAESTWGNRLIKDKTFNGYETDTAYESNLYLDIYGNYDDVGNFSLDLRKFDEEEKMLNGALYDVVVTRPDGSKIIKRDLEITDKVEFEGILVSKGTTIEMTEKKAPNGYKENEYTETLRISEVYDDGSLEIELDDAGYAKSRAKISDTQSIKLSDETMKTFVTLDLIDQNLNTFKFGITTKDSVSSKGVSGFKYELRTSKGSQVESGATNSSGKVTTLVGASFAGQTVQYTIKEIQTAKYYKPLKEPITLDIVYAADGTVDGIETVAVQTDPNYKKTWDIVSTSTEKGNDIDIEIFNDPQDTFNVQLETVDKITGQKINDVEYQVSPCINLEGKGKTDIEIGYVAPGDLEVYTLRELTKLPTYQTLDTQTFSILYSNEGKILEVSKLSKDLELIEKAERTVKFKVYIEPKVPITITSVGYFDNKPLDGTEYTIIGKETQTVKTNKEGVAVDYDGILGTNENITYIIKENKITSGYVKLDKFKIKVHYNANREIDNVSLIGEENRWISVTYKTPSESTDTGYNGNNKGIVQITLKHYPEFLINITNKDRLDNSINLAGTQYSVTSSINTSDSEVITNSDGLGVAKLGQTLMNDKIVYTIVETRAASLYQTLEKAVKVEVYFDENGYVETVNLIDGTDFASASKIENITDPRDNFAINVEIRNCKMLKFNITVLDSQDEKTAVRGLKFNANSELNGKQIYDIGERQTDINGQLILGFDKDYANETIRYTIKETKKIAGYQFLSENLIIEVTFDSQGRVIEGSVRMLQGAGYTEITNIDTDGFNIDLKILNSETEEFEVEIKSVDKYDDSIKMKNVNYEIYMMTADHTKDDKYYGKTTTDEFGEGTVQYGKYVSSNPNGNETRQIMIKETNLPFKYRKIRAEIVVNVTFDANGKVIGTNVPGGYTTYLGWIADSRFVSVTYRNHSISVTIKHYPCLNVKIQSVEKYGENFLEGKYRITTTRGRGYSDIEVSKLPMQNKIQKIQEDVYKSENRGATIEDVLNRLSKDPSIYRVGKTTDGNLIVEMNDVTYTINSILEVTRAKGKGYYSSTITGYTNIDYIGSGDGEILDSEILTTPAHVSDPDPEATYAQSYIGPTETNSATRTFYIYEEKEPSSPMQYQRYRPQKYTYDESKIIASFTLKYNNKGRIDKITEIAIYSHSNVKDFINIDLKNQVEETPNDNLSVYIRIQYAPITTMEVKTIDNVSKSGISNARVYPYLGYQYSTQQSYEYRTNNYYTTNSEGKTSFTYWGGSVAGDENTYIIYTSLMSNTGYLEQTKPVEIKVAYDEKTGRISSAKVTSKDDISKMANAEVSYEDNKLKVNIIFNRKMNLVIQKQDEYDTNKKLTAKFNIKSNKDENASITSNSLTQIGMVRPGEKVEYTLSETSVPQGYKALENIKFTVTYNKDGTINKENIKSDSSLFEVVSTREKVDTVRTTDVEDLRIIIKNQQMFTVKLDVMDKYYNDKKLSDVTFNITNDKGDTAIGNPVTDANGTLTAYISKVYKNETVTYTITQTSTPSGYKENNTPIQVQVNFNENGKIEGYNIVNENKVSRIDKSKYLNERYIKVDILNFPKDIDIGIKNYDEVTYAGISGITFKINEQEIQAGSAKKEKSIITNKDGTVKDTIDEFKETSEPRIVEYTVSQINIPKSYRKIQDVVFRIFYDEDGTMSYRTIISNPSNINVNIASGGKLQYMGSIPVHILLSIPNDNAYDIKIKDEDTNYEGLGIDGTIYDVSINGKKESTTTNSEGIAKIINRKENGNITIQIGENTPGIGYKKDNNNATTIVLEKGEEEYSLKLISNSNPTYAQVEVNEEYGIVNVKFKNETTSSLTLVKDEKEVRYQITSEEVDKEGDLIDAKIIGEEDINDENPQEKLKYDLGVTPQNKTIVYTFEELSYPVTYHKVGTFKITVEYDIYGGITNITSNSDRVKAREIPERSHDIVVVILEYVPDKIDGDGSDGNNEKTREGTITIVKDNKNVKYEVGYKEVDEEGNESNSKLIGTEETDIKTREQAYFEIGKLTANKTIVFTIKELSVPDEYSPIGMVEITAKTDENGYIYEINSNSERAKAKLIPPGTNDIAVIIGEEYGSLVLTKADKNVRYQITSEEENGETTENKKVVFDEEDDDVIRKKVYICLREKVLNKPIIYTFKEKNKPDGYDARDEFSVTVEYGENGEVRKITKNDDFIIAKEIPKGSNDVYVTVLTNEQLEAKKEAYTIKVVSQEIDSNLRINDSVFNIDITQGEGNFIAKMANVKTANVEAKGYILEKGVIKTDGIKNKGTIDINVDQQKTAEGYRVSDKVHGTVKIDVDYIELENEERYKPVFSVLDNDGFDILLDNTNKVITIKVNNIPEINMEITNILRTKDENDNIVKTPLNSSKFTITSQIQTKTDITDTSLNVTTAMTDENGKTEAKVGVPYAGKTVLYTIHQIEREEYTEIADVVLLVQYDTKGNIKYQEILSNPDDAEVKAIKESKGEKGARNIQVVITNTPKNYKYGYRVVVRKHHTEDGEYGELIPGAKFKIEVEQEYGEFNRTWEATTDSEGMITSDLFDGYGNISVKITELDAPEGFNSLPETLETKAIRNKNTGKLSIVTSDTSYDFSENDDILYIDPVNEPKEELYTIIINKADTKTEKLITESQAKFDVKMIGQENVGTEEEPEMEDVETYLGQFGTDNKGKAKIENLQKPEEPGIYKYEITEIKEPNGYVKLEEPVILQIEFEKDSKGKIVMKDNPTILSGDASIRGKKNDLLNITINNLNEKDLNKYTLDITKKDAETGEAIENMALFKVWLPDSENTALYAETMNNIYGTGKLDYCYIEQDKDYRTRLTSMQIPTEEGTLKYIFREAVAPEGYTRIEEDLELDIVFKKDESTGKIYIDQIISSNEDYLKINTKTPCSTDTVISIDILNRLQEEAKYTIHYDANDEGEGTTVPEDQIKEKDIDLPISEEEPTREGYTFKGWTTIADSTTVQYKPGDLYKVNQDSTLYAVWEQDLYLKSTEYLIGNGVNPKDLWSPGEESKYEKGDLYIKGIRPQAGVRVYNNLETPNTGTYLEELLSKLDTNADDIKVYIPEKDEDDEIILKDENIVGDNRLIGTGMIIKLTKGDQEIRLTLIVRGDLIDKEHDVVGDGRVANMEGQKVKYLNASTLNTLFTIEEQQALDYYINTDIRWSTNKQAIRRTYHKFIVESIR